MLGRAIVVEEPDRLSLRAVELADPGPADVVVEIAVSGISTGTERLLFEGSMPPFPGLGYPLVPGYESVGEVVEAGPEAGLSPGARVFVPGTSAYRDVRGLFGGAAERLVVPAARVTPVSAALGQDAVLLALAATAYHTVASADRLPELIVGHGVLGRLLARLVAALGEAPTVWEAAPARRSGAAGYAVIAPEDDARRDYAAICDMSGDAAILDALIPRLARGGEITLAGFYKDRVGFAFPPAFLKEARIRIAAEWAPRDMAAVLALVEDGRLSLAGLLTHRAKPADAEAAYRTAFTDPDCLKMILDWRDA